MQRGDFVGEISGVSQMPGDQQEGAAAGFLNSFAAFCSSQIGRDYKLYLETSAVVHSILTEMMLCMWRWATDVGLWTKGRAKNTKVWRIGRPGTHVRAIRLA